jgi:hypothetical protein
MSITTIRLLVAKIMILAMFSQLNCCGMYITRQEFDVFMANQKKRDDGQDATIEDTTSKLACNNATVQQFLAKCKENNSVCSTTEIVPAIKAMRGDFPYRIIRVPYKFGETLTVTESQKADLVSLFSGRVLTSTKILIVGISSHEAPTALMQAKTSRHSRKVKVSTTPPPIVGDINQDEVLNQLRRFRNTFLYEPYKVSEKMIGAIKPQAPSCDRKADGLIDYFRELKENQLREEERKMNRPWMDIIVFMVDCQ